MINKFKYKKSILFLIVLLLSIGINVKDVYGDLDGEIFAGYDNFDESGGSDGEGGSNYLGPPPVQDAKIYKCGIRRSSNFYSKIYGYKYDIYGNQYRLDDTSFKTLAGTYIGLNVYEKKGYTKTGSYDVTAKRVNYDCEYEKTYTYTSCTECIENNKKTQCCTTHTSTVHTSSHPPSGSRECPAISGFNLVSGPTRNDIDIDPTSTMIADCRSRATPKHTYLTSSYKATYKDSNDIDEINGTSATIEGSGSCDDGGPTYSGSGASGTVEITRDCEFKYNREKTCINIQTSEVRYISTSESCDSDTEYTITMKDNYWKYFVPLNANSKNGFSFAMNPNNNSVQSVGMCQNIVDNYDNYRDLIKPAKGSFEANETKSQAKRRIAAANGCYYQSTITIPIEQKFYNELEDGITFNGFNFYYKVIDVDNPFPNTLPNYSIWKDLEKNNSANIEFGSITYEADIITSNIQKIRTYNQNNLYTNWLNMKNKGNTSISEFVEKEQIVVRLQKNNSYKLGCGISNTDLEVSSSFYQEECVS